MEALKKKKMTKSQANAESKAVKILERAKRLLKDDDGNVEEAQRLRFEVTHNLLPSHKMYIMRKDPKSLLLDVDKRIHQARFRLFRNGGEEKAPEITSSGYENAKQYYSARYGKMTQSLRRRSYYTMGWLLFVFLSAAILLAVMQKYESSNEFISAFNWIRR
ncbi:MAG: hypothetical protein AB1656_06480 [Candidatus Omnitrophota bacterium]